MVNSKTTSILIIILIASTATAGYLAIDNMNQLNYYKTLYEELTLSDEIQDNLSDMNSSLQIINSIIVDLNSSILDLNLQNNEDEIIRKIVNGITNISDSLNNVSEDILSINLSLIALTNLILTQKSALEAANGSVSDRLAQMVEDPLEFQWSPVTSSPINPDEDEDGIIDIIFNENGTITVNNQDNTALPYIEAVISGSTNSNYVNIKNMYQNVSADFLLLQSQQIVLNAAIISWDSVEVLVQSIEVSSQIIESHIQSANLEINKLLDQVEIGGEILPGYLDQLNSYIAKISTEVGNLGIYHQNILEILDSSDM